MSFADVAVVWVALTLLLIAAVILKALWRGAKAIVCAALDSAAEQVR